MSQKRHTRILLKLPAPLRWLFGAEGGEELGQGLAVVVIGRILACTDFLAKCAAALEEDEDEQGADNRPIDNTYTSGNREEIERAPDALFGEIVRVTTASP